MTATKLEVLALAISEMNSATTPKSEAFVYKNPGKLRELNGNMRGFSTWAGGLKSLISELGRYEDSTPLLQVLRKYGCSTMEREMVVLDYLSQALEKVISKDSLLEDLA